MTTLRNAGSNILHIHTGARRPTRGALSNTRTSVERLTTAALLDHDRSLRELRVWVDELEAAGINIVVDKAGGCPTARASADDTSNGLSRGSLEYVQHQDGDFLAEFGNDLEGGACSECVPTLVVGNKADVVEAAIGDRGWANLPTALEGKLHVCVVSDVRDLAYGVITKEERYNAVSTESAPQDSRRSRSLIPLQYW